MKLTSTQWRSAAEHVFNGKNTMYLPVSIQLKFRNYAGFGIENRSIEEVGFFCLFQAERLESEADELVELEALKKDAARWRAIRDNWDVDASFVGKNRTVEFQYWHNQRGELSGSVPAKDLTNPYANIPSLEDVVDKLVKEST